MKAIMNYSNSTRDKIVLTRLCATVKLWEVLSMSLVFKQSFRDFTAVLEVLE